ncbi:AcrR family transcriptional regulator [Nocardioides luteus]|uniref:TetR family transcriptional regulator n=1 Tax=Nocardioides luteus TaxID=1844 RepID=A0ABQ5SYA0_9ACTN|nr:TetR/AcrR family transcriptional regulator [Nocardioides luteus]MDR7312561.1 AcrR family transcriptional regulator [Nocardioides luteus]GGR45896.1 TetR family transcriptional regulator [Nocardioides luteus]GLJ68809.1 TetR family transcriptional regulator [Nocardioides luteus]
MRSAPADETTRDRILSAAVLRFAREGFGASVRSIAGDAGVSPALVIHHFGTKDELHAECDERVLAEIRATKSATIDEITSGQGILHRFANADEYAPMLGYVLRSLQSGGPVGRAFIEQMIEDAVGYTKHGIEAGLIKPSRDERARARYLVLSALGALTLELSLDPSRDPRDIGGTVRSFLATGYLPMIELYTQGVFTTRRMLDDYLLYVPDPPDDAAAEPASD